MLEETILGLLVSDHLQLRILIRECEKKTAQKDNSLHDSFKKLKQSMEKHIQVEENALFSYLNKEFDDNYHFFQRLVNEHLTITEMLSRLEDEVSAKSGGDFAKLKEYFEQHEHYEEYTLYRILDKLLTDDQKKSVIEKIRSGAVIQNTQ